MCITFLYINNGLLERCLANDLKSETLGQKSNEFSQRKGMKYNGWLGL